MNATRTIAGFLGSRSLTLWLTGAFILSYITAAVWSEEAFASFVAGLATNVPVMVGYLLFSVNVLIRSTGALNGVRNRPALFLMKLPLSAGAVLLLFSFFLSVNLREGRWMIAGEGDVFRLPGEESAVHVLQVDIPIRKNMLVTKDSALFAYEPSVMLADRSGTITRVGAFPPVQMHSALLHIMNFGIGPGVELRSGKTVVQRGEIPLRLIPFGNVDTFEFPPSPYRFYVGILPTRTVKKGKESAHEYDLTRPRYRVEVVKGDRTIARTETDTTVLFDGWMSLRFFTPSPWVQLEAVHDPFRTWFIAGCALLLTGTLLLPLTRLLERRRA